MGRVLVADGNPDVALSLQTLLTGAGHEVMAADSSAAVLEAVRNVDVQTVVLAIQLADGNSMDAFRQIMAMRPRLPVILMALPGSAEAAIEAMKLGAFDYVLKPYDPEEMSRLVEDALTCVKLMTRKVVVAPSAKDAGGAAAGDVIVGQSPQMQQVYKAIGRVAQTDATVLIRGPTGTGKELVARAIFQHSLRNDKPLMAMNCTAIPDTLLEGELFGYERGAFTGAHTRRIGKLEQSDGGTIFLDEIGDMPLTVQAKILRVLQEMRFERLGGNRTIQVDVRIIAATNRPLEEAMGAGLFRSDLYHRLNVFTINLPPLRERQEDIPLLTDFFLDRFSGRLGIDRPVVAPTAMSVLRAYPWPGNVRELEHCIHRALILTRGYPIQPADVRRTLETQGSIDTGVKPVNGTAAESLRSLVRDYLQNHNGSNTFTEYVDQVEKILVAEALRKTHGNQTHAARLLGLSRPTLQAKMQKYGIYKESRVHD